MSLKKLWAKFVKKIKIKKFIKEFDFQNYKEDVKENPFYQEIQQRKQDLVSNHYDNEIVRRVDSHSNYVQPEFSKVTVTQGVIDEGKYVSGRMSYVSGESVEVSMALGALPDSTIIDRMYVVHGQVVNGVHCTETPKGKIYTQIEMGKDGRGRIGWSHSHGASRVFFSAEDKGNIRRSSMHGVNYEIDLLDDDEGSLPVSVSMYPALVFNDHMGKSDMPYAGIGVSYQSFLDGSYRTVLNERLPVNVVDSKTFDSTNKDYDEILRSRVEVESSGLLDMVYRG